MFCIVRLGWLKTNTNPSTSFFGAMRFEKKEPCIPNSLGRGSWSRIPCTSGLPFRLKMAFFGDSVAASQCTSHSMPIYLLDVHIPYPPSFF